MKLNLCAWTKQVHEFISLSCWVFFHLELRIISVISLSFLNSCEGLPVISPVVREGSEIVDLWLLLLRSLHWLPGVPVHQMVSWVFSIKYKRGRKRTRKVFLSIAVHGFSKRQFWPVSSLSPSQCCCSAGPVELLDWGPLYSSAALPGEAHHQQSPGTLPRDRDTAPQGRGAQLPAQALQGHPWRKNICCYNAACHHLASVFVPWCKQDTADWSALSKAFAPSQALSSCLVNMA